MPKSPPHAIPESEQNEVPSASPDFRTELAAQLAELVPEAVTDGRIDARKLAELLGEDAADESERFGLFWPGKKRALRAAQAPTTATLKPDFANSKHWDTTQNVFIEGDNLEVLKILQRHYHNKIKLIYIDPPYNTGRDFVYPDNFTEGLDTYLEWTRQVNEEGKKVSTNSETEGRYHSNWLNMIYPRLKLARNLLTDDGVIFISIDDNEFDNLRKICNEIFGESNFVGAMKRRASRKSANLSTSMSDVCDYVVVYTRTPDSASLSVETISDSTRPVFNAGNKKTTRTVRMGTKARCDDQVFPAGEYKSKTIRYTLQSDLRIDNGIVAADLVVEGPWRINQEVLDKTIFVTRNGGFRRSLLEEEYEKVKIINDLIDDPEYYNEKGSETIKELFGDLVFDTPKPWQLIKYLVLAGTEPGEEDQIVLDFFAGASTTSHSVMQLNADGDSNRRFIMVQLPEPIDATRDSGKAALKAGFRTIADISRKRIELAGQKIGKGDAGFRAYKLTDTNFAKWRVTSEVTPTQLEQHLLDLRDSADDAASQDDLLTELLLKLGLSLTETIVTKTIAGLEVREVGNNRVLACVDEDTKPTLEQLRALVDAAPGKLVMLEDAFHGDDQLKTNLAQYAKTRGIELRTA